MSPFLRKVKTASGATAVQIVQKKAGKRTILEHLGSAHTQAELAALVRVGQAKLHHGQGELDLGLDAGGVPVVSDAVVKHSRSELLTGVVTASWRRLGFDVIDDEAFFQLVLARLVEPTSKLDSIRVIDDLGLAPKHRNTYANSLRRCLADNYRGMIANACFEHVHTRGGGDVSLILFDCTTLFFHADNEDDLRKPGYSKERRIDPQIVVGLLVDRTGFPLEIQCFEGNKAETETLIPVIEDFQGRHGIEAMVVVADAGMLSYDNLTALDEAGFLFIVGSRMTKAPHDLAKHFHWNGTLFTDGQIIDTITTKRGGGDKERLTTRAEPVWDRETHPAHWRAVWHYSASRARRDERTLNAQEARAREIAAGERTAKKARFVTTNGGTYAVNEATLARARDLVGLKGYVTNIPARLMPATEIIASYHDLWHVEQSFRMSKSDLAARPIFHRTRDAIDAHLTIVFTALAIARDLQTRSGLSLKKIITTLKPLRTVTITITGHDLQAHPELDNNTQKLLRTLGH